MKKTGAIFIIGLLILPLLLILVKAQIENQIQEAGENLEQTAENIEQTKSQVETKWDYLSKEWKTILLKNNIISALDSFFTKISIFFRILFGMNYSLSITLLFVIVLWLFFLAWFYDIFKVFSFFSHSTSFLVSLALVVILAQTQIFLKIITLLGFLFFAEKDWSQNIIASLIIIIIFLMIYILRIPIKNLILKLEKSREEMRKKVAEAREKARKGKATAAEEALIKAFGDSY